MQVTFAQNSDLDQSVVYIACEKDGVAKYGTGAIVSKLGHVLTAKHVAGQGSTCYGNIGLAVLTGFRQLTWREDSNLDATLLQFPSASGEEFNPVKLAKISKDLKGAPIHILGFPSNTTGEISVRRGYLSTTHADAYGHIQTDVLSTQGMSGAPVFVGDKLVAIVAGANFTATGTVSDYAVLSVESIGRDILDLEIGKGAKSAIDFSHFGLPDLPLTAAEFFQSMNLNPKNLFESKQSYVRYGLSGIYDVVNFRVKGSPYTKNLNYWAFFEENEVVAYWIKYRCTGNCTDQCNDWSGRFTHWYINLSGKIQADYQTTNDRKEIYRRRYYDPLFDTSENLVLDFVYYFYRVDNSQESLINDLNSYKVSFMDHTSKIVVDDSDNDIPVWPGYEWKHAQLRDYKNDSRKECSANMFVTKD